ncbi:MAG: YcxB family protein [Oscillibacter sp.]|nr:YcxB family protein [Oscillibacter sp.]
MVFENTTLYDKEALYALADVQIKTSRRTRIRRWVLLIAGGWCCIAGILLLWRLRRLDFSGHIVTGMTLVLGPMGVLQGLFYRSMIAARIRRQLQGDDGPRRCFFTEDAFQAEKAGVRSVYSYDLVQNAYELPGYFVLALDKIHCVILSMAGFTQGTPDDFRAFIEQRLHGPVRYLR